MEMLGTISVSQGMKFQKSPRDKLGTKQVCACLLAPESFDFRTPKDQGDY